MTLVALHDHDNITFITTDELNILYFSANSKIHG